MINLVARGCAITLLGSSVLSMLPPTATAQGTSRPIMVTQGREMAAFFQGDSCDSRVGLEFRGKSIEDFKVGNPLAARLMNNVANIIRNQCAEVSVIAADGKVESDIVYSGVAEKATDWRVVEVGSSDNDILSSGAVAGGQSQSEFAAAEGFVTVSNLVATLERQSYLCEAHDIATNTCRSLTEIKATGTGFNLITSQYRGANGPTAAVTYTGAEDDAGFLCSNPQEAVVNASGGGMSPDGIAELERQLTARARDKGNQVCIGYTYTDSDITTQSFNEDNAAMTQIITIKPFATAPGLRFDD